MNNKQLLEEEIEGVKKALNSINWRYKFFQNKASVDPKRQNMDLLAQMTQQKGAQEEYLKFLEEHLEDAE